MLVNPVGGKGGAVELYKTQVAPILQQASIESEVVVTEFHFHGREIAAKMPLNSYDCVVAVGGDGMLFEILQGLMGCSDWQEVIKQPLAVSVCAMHMEDLCSCVLS